MNEKRSSVFQTNPGVVGLSPEPLGSHQPPRLDELSNGYLLDYFVNSWRIYEWLFSSIDRESAFYQNPDPLRHPLIFYWGHTAAFYINKLVRAGMLAKGINPRFETLFEMGVDPETSGELPTFQNWPDLDKVNDYRDKVFEIVGEFIENADLSHTVDMDDPMWGLLMGIEHDRIHFETSSVLIRQYPSKILSRPMGWEYAPQNRAVPSDDLISMPAGAARLGKQENYPTFGWDNEYGQREAAVSAFEAGRNLVTNGEFLTFVEDGGYDDPKNWTDEGRLWKKKHGIRYPRFWVTDENRFRYRAMFDVIDMPLDWPVEVNALEASAYCKWRGSGFRLLTEPEFRRLTVDIDAKTDPALDKNAFNLHIKYGSPTPAGWIDTATERGFNDLYGNVWEWLADNFNPLPGFQSSYLYEDFSIPYFDDRHAMLLGGSWATTGTGASKYYRLWFRRFFFQHAGFRLARDLR